MNLAHFLLYIAALWIPSVHAQTSQPQPPKEQGISYRRPTPKIVSRQMPRSAKSLFWGTWENKGDKQLLGIHLYNTRRQEPAYNFTRTLQLDIFRKDRTSWRRLNRVLVRYQTGFDESDRLVQSQLLWLDARGTIPLLRLRVFTNKEAEGPIGDEISVAFPKGWRSKAASHSWVWGSWFSSNSIGQENDWSQRDDKGFLQVVGIVTKTNVWQPKERSYWQWRGDNFYHTRQEVTRLNVDGKEEVVEVPVAD